MCSSRGLALMFGKRPACVQVQAELEKLQQAAEAGRAEKDEMGRLYNELLEQLRAAEEEKEELRVRGRRGRRVFRTKQRLWCFQE